MRASRSRVVVYLLALTVLLAATGVWLYWCHSVGPVAFHRALWLQGERAGFTTDAPRLRMANGLVQSRVLIGLHRTQVEAMLGPQTPGEYFKPEYQYVYWLGAERGYISIDSEWLALKLDAQGVVTEAQIVRD